MGREAVERLRACPKRVGADLGAPQGVHYARPRSSGHKARGQSQRVEPHWGITLAEKLRHICERDVAYPDPIEVDQLKSDLELILIDRATEGSDIFHKLHNVKQHGGIIMYAVAFKWFTETSGLGLAEQSAAPIVPKPAARKEDIAEAIELWEEKCGNL